MKENEIPTTIVIFGASGDLTRRKLVPALYHQSLKGRIPPANIVGSSRSPFTNDSFRQRMREGIVELAGLEIDESHWNPFSNKLWYLGGDVQKLEDMKKLAAYLDEIEGGPANRLYYLATVPAVFPIIVENLGKIDMTGEARGWRRIVVEKPFGHDLKSATDLNNIIHAAFDESQIYRIDHYLGKETAQNILYFRFLNSIFEPLWNRNHIDHVQITVAETVDIEHRAGYYDTAGVLRDMFQNHLLQLLTLVAMEPAATSYADAVRNEKVKVLQAIRCSHPEETIRAQYEGYREAEGVALDSQTPTYGALKLFIDNWRWQGVPFYLRSGKALAEKTSEIVIEFKPPPHVMFPLPAGYQLTPNFLSLCIQPDEGIHLRFETKVPDSQRETRSVDMEFHYRTSFGAEPLPDAYERLLLDALNGDASLFTRSDEIEAAWRLIDPILLAWEHFPQASPLVSYRPGSWGPEEADLFLQRDNRVWRRGCEQ
jgi:glucose-6-phosphate 1-dehydrogenase